MPRPRTWSDDDLRTALQGATSWKAVCLTLRVPVGGRTVTALRTRASELGLDTSALYGGGRRGDRLARVTDEELRATVAASTTLVAVGRALGVHVGRPDDPLARRVAELGIDTSHFRTRGYNGQTAVPAMPQPFGGPPRPERLRFAAIGLAIAWFGERGVTVSLPVEPAAYDLVADGPDGLARVQVKTSTAASRVVGFTRSLYDPDGPSSPTTGKIRRVGYEPGVVDLFFVAMGDGSMYLIPYAVIGRRKEVRLGTLMEAFRVAGPSATVSPMTAAARRSSSPSA